MGKNKSAQKASYYLQIKEIREGEVVVKGLECGNVSAIT